MRSILGSPYYLATLGATSAMQADLRDLADRVERLRTDQKLTDATLRDYYGLRRFEQVAESNALEGSTLSVGETELAVLQGITISGHDPGFSRDAQALAKAVDELVELAKAREPTDLDQLRRIHELVLEGRKSAGSFRTSEVRIAGSAHTPPRTWQAVMGHMEDWERWSIDNQSAPPLLRSAVLHAWLEHIHPFLDGNGRTGRAVTNLELIRAGYPPIIIRKKDRDIYLGGLRDADEGDLGGFIELISGRLDVALGDLERSASSHQGYDPSGKVGLVQSNRLALWNAGVNLIVEVMRSRLVEQFAGTSVQVEVKRHDQLEVDGFIELSEGRPVRQNWLFTVRLRGPGMPSVQRLACASPLGQPLDDRLAGEPGRPSIRWSVPNPDRYPFWLPAGSLPPAGEEMTILNDRWLVLRDGQIFEKSPSELGAEIAEAVAGLMVPDPSP